MNTMSRRAMLSAFAESSQATREKIMKTSTIDGPQGRLAIYSIGAGRGLPILFLHGDCSRASQWQQVMQSSANGRQAVAFDFRGHGASAPAADGDYGYHGRAADLGAVADALKLKRFLIVAHSGAAGTALAYAADHASHVAGIVLVDPATDPRALSKNVRDGFARDLAGPHAPDTLKAYYASIAGPNAAVRERVLADASVVDPAAVAGVGKALAEWNPEPALDAYYGPMLVLATEPNDNPAALYRLRAGIAHQVVADAGHWVMLDKPGVVAEAVNSFITAIEAGHE
ncbi:alpha/beta fold hydrolase [Mesorhizobium sp. ORS 3428]|uniref:alpha/beta fold hydrolase n=1 Tax=Mesorhizobium sp. ORS 3428 TaxID=540997 RepID=UPI000A92BD41|nr:alpha/beta fold hydrolase [Mesorhizobium sp. ORS 3428]